MINLLHGDCLELMKDIPNGSIDAIITDPPYGTTACKWDSVIDFKLMWEQLNRIIKPNGAIVLFGSEPFSSHLRMSNIKMFKYDWVWKKNQATGFLNAKKYPLKDSEIISIFCKKLHCYFPQMSEGKSYSYKKNKIESDCYGDSKGTDKITNSGRYPKTTIEFKKATKTVHPTQKPVALLEYLIKTYTLEGETVLDFTMGSGSTGVAAKNLNRKFIGIEMDDKYFKIAKERIANV